jgi:hypothetical protein
MPPFGLLRRRGINYIAEEIYHEDFKLKKCKLHSGLRLNKYAASEPGCVDTLLNWFRRFAFFASGLRFYRANVESTVSFRRTRPNTSSTGFP